MGMARPWTSQATKQRRLLHCFLGRRIPILNRITSLQNGKEAVVIGTLYKTMKKKIRVLDEFLDDVSCWSLL